jgi:glutamate carboxypeptidase
MDTVFPPDTAFNFYKEDERHSYGPGVIDMKGGLVVALYALKALDAAGQLSEIPITLICNADEEIGSGSSGALIRDAARKSAFAFVMECGGLDGAVVTGRKGNLSAKIDITGQAGHAAFADQGKSSAILELAHKIIALEALNDPDSGVTVNVGLIKGGIGANTVPAQASARIDMRFLTPADGALLEKRLNHIVAQPCLPGTGSSCRIMSRRPPMPECERNKDLFRYVQSTAADLGQSIRAEFRYGVSDANLIADENIPVIDGLGPIGANDHSADEYMVKSSLLARTTLLACAIPACWRKYTAKHF